MMVRTATIYHYITCLITNKYILLVQIYHQKGWKILCDPTMQLAPTNHVTLATLMYL
jgi:hypothetical protein